MTAKISARNLVKEGWQQGLAALGPNLRWLCLFALAGGLYSASLRLDGNLAANGMVSFADYLTPDEAEAIRAYVLTQGHAAVKAGGGK